MLKKGNNNKVELKVYGMTCAHCEMHIKNALEKVNGVKSAKADRKKENAIVYLKDGIDVATEKLVKAVNDSGYKAEE